MSMLESSSETGSFMVDGKAVKMVTIDAGEKFSDGILHRFDRW